MNPYEANRRHWDDVTPVHMASAMYDVAGFLAGKHALHQFVIDAVRVAQDAAVRLCAGTPLLQACPR